MIIKDLGGTGINNLIKGFNWSLLIGGSFLIVLIIIPLIKIFCKK